MTLSFAFLFPEGKDVPWASMVKPMGMAMLGGHGRRLAAASHGCDSASRQQSPGCVPATGREAVTWGRMMAAEASRRSAGMGGGRDRQFMPPRKAWRWRGERSSADTSS